MWSVFLILYEEHFAVWMEIAPNNRFSKLWGIINRTLEAGEYTLIYENSISLKLIILLFFTDFNVTEYPGLHRSKKSFQLSTTNRFGGKNDKLYNFALICGGFSLFLFLFNLFKKSKLEFDESKLSFKMD